MSGRSKWHNIQGRKSAQDVKRGKVFQKLSCEIYMAAETGGPDLSMNPALRLVVDKAKATNMLGDNVERATRKATSAAGETNYDETTYEGYGPGGVGVLIHALTDDRNRTTTDVQVAFTRDGGSLGETGSVGYLFDRKGYIAVERNRLTADEEAMFKGVLGAGAEDL